MNLLLAGILSSVSGVVIGTLGAGGSILMIPILVYVLQMPVKTAMGITLLTIGLTGFWPPYPINGKRMYFGKSLSPGQLQA